MEEVNFGSEASQSLGSSLQWVPVVDDYLLHYLLFCAGMRMHCYIAMVLVVTDLLVCGRFTNIFILN